MSHPSNNVRHWALGLLLLNLAVFIGILVAQRNGFDHPALGYVKAFAEAACIGALADWFAVVALFRHPLGIPLPHTAILPAKQAQLAQGVAKFIGTHFLDPAIIAEQLARLQVGERLNTYAQSQLTTEVIAKRLPKVLQSLMTRVPINAPDKLIIWSQESVTNYLSGDRLGRSTARLIQTAQEQQLDKKLVNALAASIHEFVTAEDAKERVRPWLNELVSAAQKADASWWEKVKTQFTGQAIEWADDWLIEKALTWLADFTAKVQSDDAHPVHAWVGTHIDGWKDQLFNDEQWHAWLATHVHDWLRTPTAEELVKTIWDKSRAWLDAAAQADSVYIEPLSSKIRDVILNTMSDADQQDKLTDKTAHVAANLLTEYQQDIRDWLTGQMNAWSKERLTGALENAIGRDLQYIRINGTLIGGLIGVFLYVVGRII
jgi:uncharacterized membrane-anchored protein YjiN (DUF445 family)